MALIERNTTYSLNDIVNTRYGTKLKCTTAGTTSTDPLILDGTSPITDGTVVWEVQEEGGSGQGLVDYAPNTSYNVGDIVIYDNKIYRCITSHTSTATFDDTKWEKIGDEVFTGEDAGLVPDAPAGNKENLALFGDGSWKSVEGGGGGSSSYKPSWKYTWAEVKQAINDGTHTSLFEIGDRFIVQITNLTSGSYTYTNYQAAATLIGFNHNKDLESNGKNSMHFMIDSNYLQKSHIDRHFSFIGVNFSDDVYSWKDSKLQTWLNNTFFNSISSDLRSIISTVTKYSARFNPGGDTLENILPTNDKIWLFSASEIYMTRGGYMGTYEGQKSVIYDYFKYIKAIDLGFSAYYHKNNYSYDSNAINANTRTMCSDGSSDLITTGGNSSYTSRSNPSSYIPCFAIVAD